MTGWLMVVQVAGGCGLGMGLMALAGRLERWERKRRLAALREVGRARHAAGAPHPDRLDELVASFTAGLAAQPAPPVTADPADPAFRRPSAMLPEPWTELEPLPAGCACHAEVPVLQLAGAL